MAVILNLTWAIVLLPLVGVGAAFLAESPRRAAQIGVAFTTLALAVALVVLIFRLTHGIDVYENTQTFWDLQVTTSGSSPHLFAPEFPVFWGIRVDPLSVVFMASALFLSLVAQLHALSSMRGDAGFRRFFWVVGALTFGVLASISSPNIFQFWLGTEVVGVATWMLAVHQWQRPATVAAAARTFVVLQIADLILLLGMIMTFAKFSTAVTERPATNGQLINDPLSFSALTPQWHLGHVGAVTGVGARTLVVIAVLFLVTVVIRAAVGPLHLWLSGTLEAPVAGLALIAAGALVPPAVLIARVYPLLAEAPHLLTVVALVGALGALAGAVVAAAQRDLFRIGMFAVSSQAGLVLAAFGMGGFSPALFTAFTASFLAVAYFLAAGNVSRGFRSRDLADCGGGRRRMPLTTLALGGWALGVSGLSLNTYSVLSATFRNTLPTGGHLSTLTQVVVALAVLVTIALTALYAFRVYFTVATGEPVRRRGFDVARLREVDPRRRNTVFAALAGAAVATLGGIPGVGVTFSHLVFYGSRRQVLALDFAALALAAVIAAGGAVAAMWLFSARRDELVVAVRNRVAAAGALLGGPTPSDWLATKTPVIFIRAGETLDSFEDQVLEPIVTGMGESVNAVSEELNRFRTARIGVSMAAALAVVAVLLAATVLAATGHFPVATR